MKKVVLAVTVLFAAATAAPAMAAEFSYGGFMRYRGVFADPGTTGMFGATASETSDQWEYRVRQFFNLKVNDHVTTNVKFEWNPKFGDEKQISGGAGDLQLGQLATDEVQFRIKNAFLKFDVPGAPVSLTVGQQDFSTPKAIISVEDGTGIKLNAKLDPVNLTLFWQKNVNGGKTQTGADDVNWIGVVPSFKAGDVTIAPHLSRVKLGNTPANALTGGTVDGSLEIWFVGVDVSGKSGPVGFTADFVYQTGSVDFLPAGSGSSDLASYILDASVSIAAGPGTLTGKVLYSPGDDGTDTDVDSWVNVISTDLGWSPFFHDGSSISSFTGTTQPGLTDGTHDGGIMALGVEYALSPYKDFTLTPNLYYLMAAEDLNVAGGPLDDFYGIEAGVQANWKLWDSVNMLAQLDYLFAGDVFQDAAGKTDDAWRFIIGPSISW